MRQFACFRIHRPGRVGAPRFVISRKFMRNNLLILSNGDLPALPTRCVGLPFPPPPLDDASPRVLFDIDAGQLTKRRQRYDISKF
jgi:hypothetical protein